MKVSLRSLLFTVLLLLSASPAISDQPAALQRIQYNHPGLVVDLGVGLWAWPMPMDYDGDGDLDLVVSCPDVPHNGTYFFENPDASRKLPAFKPGVRIAKGITNVQVSYDGKSARVLAPGVEYRDFIHAGFGSPRRIPLDDNFHRGKIRANQWKLVDYDADGRLDLIIGIGDWHDYGWDNAFNERGEWTRGPLHGYVYWDRNEGTNDRPKYAKPKQLTAAGSEIDVYGMPSPNLADFDGDGDLDLLCGEFIDKFTYFENVGTRAAPEYRAGRFLAGDDGPLHAHLCMIVPVAIDWDRDGDVDLVVGQEDGRVMLIEHTGRVVDGLPQFAAPRFFQQEAAELKFGALATPCGCDWDADGDQDLICGNTAGEIGFIENLDGGCPPKWAKPQLLSADGRVIRVQAGLNGSIQGPCEEKWGYTVPNVADWNHDGLPDIVVNSIWGKVIWFRNVGTRQSPKLATPQPIEVEWQSAPPKPAWNWWKPVGKALATQWRTTPFVIDLDRDSLNDLVMLDHEGYLAWFPRSRTEDGQLVLLPPRRTFTNEHDRPLRLAEKSTGASGRRKIWLVDWNGDRLSDLLVNGINVDFLRAVGHNAESTRYHNDGPVDGLRLAGHSTCPTVVRWSQVGRLDLLIGAEDGCFYYLPNRFLSTANRN